MLSKFRSEIVKYWKEDQSTIPQVFILESPEKNIIL
jgi:hypothetical protein